MKDGEVRAEFERLVNLEPGELEAWLRTQESREVGWTPDGQKESVGHQSGRHILAILRKRGKDLSEDDRAHMRKVVGYIHRHSTQGGPQDDKEHSRWRHSLMNWGHDPLK